MGLRRIKKYRDQSTQARIDSTSVHEFEVLLIKRSLMLKQKAEASPLFYLAIGADSVKFRKGLRNGNDTKSTILAADENVHHSFSPSFLSTAVNYAFLERHWCAVNWGFALAFGCLGPMLSTIPTVCLP